MKPEIIFKFPYNFQVYHRQAWSKSLHMMVTNFFSNLIQASTIFFPLNICVNLTQKAPGLEGVIPPYHLRLTWTCCVVPRSSLSNTKENLYRT